MAIKIGDQTRRGLFVLSAVCGLIVNTPAIAEYLGQGVSIAAAILLVAIPAYLNPSNVLVKK